MARNVIRDANCLLLLRELEVHLAGGVGTACGTLGISDAAY